MKNQYFGDINDYKKYGLLRVLSGYGKLETAVCWVLTEDDDRTDGYRIRYLQQAEKWRKYDPKVFDYLRHRVIELGVRDVKALEDADILPNCRYYSNVMEDDIDSRQWFFHEFLDFAHKADLVFFDPDNGLEVRSIPKGRRNSSKYLYWNEVEVTFNAGHSLLVYQHLPRKPRNTFIYSRVSKLHTITGVHRIFSYCTDHVVFFLVPRQEHEKRFIGNNARIENQWREKIVIREFIIT